VGKDQIVGAHCGTSQHAGMTAAELGCDYVEFGPAGAPGLLGDGARAAPELFRWWHQMIEVPVVAEGGITPHTASGLASITDFLCLGDELWSHPDGPEQALSAILARLK
ncbi:MAG: thiamine phosphate synthase, partial [Paracoccaceae bacterium]